MAPLLRLMLMRQNKDIQRPNLQIEACILRGFDGNGMSSIPSRRQEGGRWGQSHPTEWLGLVVLV